MSCCRTLLPGSPPAFGSTVTFLTARRVRTLSINAPFRAPHAHLGWGGRRGDSSRDSGSEDRSDPRRRGKGSSGTVVPGNVEVRIAGVERIAVPREAVVENDSKRATTGTSRGRARARPAEVGGEARRAIPVPVHRYDVGCQAQGMFAAKLMRRATEAVGQADAVG